MDTNNSQQENQQGDGFVNPVEDFNLGLLIYILNVSIVWVILIVVTCVVLSLVLFEVYAAHIRIHHHPND